MERRRALRTRFRLPTEILHDGARHHGFLLDVSPHGAFIQTPRTLPPGAEIELWFVDDQLAPQVARARVARRRNLPAAVAALMRAGIGIEWILAPQFARELDEFAIDVVLDADAVELIAGAAASADAAEIVGCEAERTPIERAEASAPAARFDPAGCGAGDEQSRDDLRGEIERTDAPPLVEQTVELAPAAVRAEVALIDEGELDDVEVIVRSLGARTLRMRWGAQADPVVWDAPPRLVIVSARVALAVPLSDTALGAGTIGVALCDSEASTLRAKLRRQGYELAAQRGAHPETLRMLFSSLLWRRRERRKLRRRAFGASTTFWRGLRRTRGTLLELSPTGGSLLLSHALPRGTKLTLRVPAEHAGGRALALPCEVVRSAQGAHGRQHGLRFERLTARARARLEALVSDLDASGPVALAHTSSPAAKPASASSDRRRAARVHLAQQALALDPVSHVARDVLFGTDLSVGGMRVESHPNLRRGAEVLLALQPQGGGPPVTLRAEVARDEGERGLVLRFVALSTTARRTIERMLAAAAEIEHTRPTRDAEDERVVMSTLVAAEPAQ
jgi:hypothetical protein